MPRKKKVPREVAKRHAGDLFDFRVAGARRRLYKDTGKRHPDVHPNDVLYGRKGKGDDKAAMYVERGHGRAPVRRASGLAAPAPAPAVEVSTTPPVEVEPEATPTPAPTHEPAPAPQLSLEAMMRVAHLMSKLSTKKALDRLDELSPDHGMNGKPKAEVIATLAKVLMEQGIED